MDLLALSQMVLDMDEAAFVAGYPHHVLIDLDAIAATQHSALEETHHEGLLPFRYGLVELRAEEGQSLILGRSVACDLIVDDPNVSSRHAELSRRPGGTWIVKDQGSTNGTAINGTPLPSGFPMPLTPGSVLGLGPGVRYTLLDPPRLYATLRPLAEDYLALMRGAELEPTAEDLAEGVTFVARCDPLPAVPLHEGQSISLGRAPDNQLVLPHPNISRRHVTLTRQGGEVIVRDLGSANGTYLGSQRIQGEVRLKPNGPPLIVGPFEVTIAGLETVDAPATAQVGEDETRRLEEVELRGSLATMPLRQLLQSVELNGRTGAIRVESPRGETGQVEFVDGRPTWASFDELRGVDALLELVSLEQGTFRFDPRGPQDLGKVPQVRDGPRVDLSFSRILMEASRRNDETRRYGRR